MKINDTVELDVTDVGCNMEGVARCDGIIAFVPFTDIGERVAARISHINKSYVFAEAVGISEPSKFRVKPPCIHFGKCGGCDCQHLSYERQSEHKERILRDTLSRAVDLFGVEFFRIKSGEKPFFYRNKLQMPIVQGKNKVLIGFFEKDSHRVVDMKRCLLHGDFADKTIAAVREYAEKYNISAYDERTGKGILRHIVARKIGEHTAVLIVVNADGLPEADGLAEILERYFDDFSLHVSVNKKNTNVVLGGGLKTLRGKFSVGYRAMGIEANISPLSFMQVNDEVRDMIYRKVLDLANGENERDITDGINENGKDIIIDAYSGGGLLTALLSKTAEKVYGIEIVKEAVNDADGLFKRNGIKNAENIEGDAAAVLPKLIERIKKERKTDGKKIKSEAKDEKTNSGANDEKTNSGVNDEKIGSGAETDDEKVKNEAKDEKTNSGANDEKIGSGAETVDNGIKKQRITVVLDPPRKGCDRAVIDALNASEPQKIIYISCNPATLARDLSLLKEKYSIISVYPYDMFPNTKHIETVVLLKLKKLYES